MCAESTALVPKKKTDDASKRYFKGIYSLTVRSLVHGFRKETGGQVFTYTHFLITSILRKGYCSMSSKVVVLYLWILYQRATVDGFTWVVPPPLSVSICSEATNTLYLNWTYTPAAPLPFLIQWTRVDTSGTRITIARFSGSTEVFTPQGPYVGRVSRAGKTAEIALTGPFTAEDAGIYKVSVTNSSGSSLDAEENVPYANVTQEPVKITSTQENTFDFTVTCSLGSATNLTLVLWDGNTRLQPDTESADGITKTIPSSSGMTIKCSVTGQGSDCRTSNDDSVKLPVSTFVTTSIIIVVIIIIIQPD
ncbi:uncharacterized protein LOC124258233 isoform X1 [Haliotis rubra]|uniref:uncharacterized protein LOC124258233 isoform X1 n=1 Tax=Haliotis rubra TaxID=36100 RepID=UPI001EE5880E|nr:uncharacterized protein LOC124258233 isoform X1 [Haliotis rubra]